MLPLWTSVTDLPLLLHREAQRGAHEPLRRRLGDRLQPDAGVGRDRPAEALADELREREQLRRAGLELVAGVDVLGVLAEQDDVHAFRVTDRRGDAGQPVDRPDVRVQVEVLSQLDVDRPEARTDRCRERSLQRDRGGVVIASSVVRGSGSPDSSIPRSPAGHSSQMTSRGTGLRSPRRGRAASPPRSPARRRRPG